MPEIENNEIKEIREIREIKENKENEKWYIKLGKFFKIIFHKSNSVEEFDKFYIGTIPLEESPQKTIIHYQNMVTVRYIAKTVAGIINTYNILNFLSSIGIDISLIFGYFKGI